LCVGRKGAQREGEAKKEIPAFMAPLLEDPYIREKKGDHFRKGGGEMAIRAVREGSLEFPQKAIDLQGSLDIERSG